MNEFVSKSNLDTLWDVISESNNLSPNAEDTMHQNIRLIFNSNVSLFSSKPNPNTLINLNKQFLTQIISAINTLHNPSAAPRLIIGEQAPHSIEDIHSLRKNKFDAEVSAKQQEFADFGLQPPPPIDFTTSAATPNEKITDMARVLEETVRQRKYDIPEFDPHKSATDFNTSVNAIMSADDAKTHALPDIEPGEKRNHLVRIKPG